MSETADCIRNERSQNPKDHTMLEGMCDDQNTLAYLGQQGTPNTMLNIVEQGVRVEVQRHLNTWSMGKSVGNSSGLRYTCKACDTIKLPSQEDLWAP